MSQLIMLVVIYTIFMVWETNVEHSVRYINPRNGKRFWIKFLIGTTLGVFILPPEIAFPAIPFIFLYTWAIGEIIFFTHSLGVKHALTIPNFHLVGRTFRKVNIDQPGRLSYLALKIISIGVSLAFITYWI